MQREAPPLIPLPRYPLTLVTVDVEGDDTLATTPRKNHSMTQLNATNPANAKSYIYLRSPRNLTSETLKTLCLYVYGTPMYFIFLWHVCLSFIFSFWLHKLKVSEADSAYLGRQTMNLTKPTPKDSTWRFSLSRINRLTRKIKFHNSLLYLTITGQPSGTFGVRGRRRKVRERTCSQYCTCVTVITHCGHRTF
jgi:hypothetical protein